MTDRIRGLAFVLVAALLLAAPLSLSAPGAVRAEVPVDDPNFAPIGAWMIEVGFDPDQMGLVAEAAEADPQRDWFHPTRQSIGITPSSADIVLSVFFEVELTPDEAAGRFGPGGILSCDNIAQVVCPTNRLNLSPATDYYVYAIVTATPFSPVAGARQEYGASLFLDPPRGGGVALPWVPSPAFPDDIFGGGNQAFVMRSDQGGPWTAFSLAHTDPNLGFEDVPTDVTFWHEGRLLVALIQGPEVVGIQSARPFTFFAQNGSFAPADSAADVYPEMAQSMLDVTGIPIISITGEPGPSEPAESQPAASEPPTTTPPPPPIDPGTVLILAAGVLLLILGGWLFFGRKKGNRCPELRAAWMAAAAACEEARKRAKAAHAESEKRAAEARAASEEAAKARGRRAELQRLLDVLNEGPDHGKSWAEGEYKGKTLRIDEYDRMLREEAYSEANARYGNRLKGAGGQGARNEAHQQWQDELNEIGEPDYIEKLREKDAGKRGERIKKVEEELAGAKEAEAKADTAAGEAKAASEKAAGAAKAADALVADVCAKADAAEKAYRAECEPGAAAPKPADAGPPPPEPPKPPDQPKPPEPGGPGGGGGGPPPGGGGGGGGEEPPPKGTDCEDGTEEWRPYGPARIFWVPRPGKVRIECEPAIDELTEWLESWQNVDSKGKPTEETDFGGVPQLFFRRLDGATVNSFFARAKAMRDDQTITITLPMQLVTVQCERKWICRNGRWVQTDQCQGFESHETKDKEFKAKGANLGPAGLKTVMNQAITAMKSAADRDREREQAKKDCEACK